MIDRSAFREHLERIKGSVSARYSLADMPQWICNHTKIRGENYSFKDHEFQEFIVSSEDVEVNTQKCSQIGLSEVTARWVMAVSYNFPAFSTIVTFPFSGDAENFARTRVDPFIEASEKLKEAMNNSLDNSSVKQIKESMIYFRGTNGITAAISIPADCIVSDEIDRSNPGILTQYTSRLTHSPYKWRRNFSTPTVKGYGIDLKMQASRRYKSICKCNHCNHYFIPSFFDDVKIPGYENELRTLNKHSLERTRWREAKLICPKCKVEPNLFPAHREYVCENNEATFDAKGIYVSPFDAPAIITPVSLLKAMVEYARLSEFVNQNLGLTSEEASESLTLADLVNATKITDLNSTALHAMGCDMGVICYIAIGRLTLAGEFLVVHREKVHIDEFDKRRRILKKLYSVAITVCDSQPYVDVILRIQQTDKNAFGAIFLKSKTLEIFKVKMFEGEKMDGKLPIHLVQIQKDKALDELMGKFKANEVVIQQSSDPDVDDEFQKHCLDMKRVQRYDDNEELTYCWEKSTSKVDHYHHTLLYLYVACRLRSTVARTVSMEGAPLIGKFKVTAAPREPIRGFVIAR